MNERIRELAEQAGAIKCHGYIPHPELDGHVIWAADVALDTKKMDAEKFAELIVRECIQSIENTIETNCDTDSEKIGCEFAITDLKEHFGVEQ